MCTIFNIGRLRYRRVIESVALTMVVAAAAVAAEGEPARRTLVQNEPAPRLVLPAAEQPRAINQPAPLLPAAAQRIRAGEEIRAAFTNRLEEERRANAPPVTTALNTSEDLERLLDKAIQVAAERPDLAPVLWQRILDEGSSAFARAPSTTPLSLRREYELYRPFSNVTLRAMIDAGPEALRHYRLHADGPARALLARQGADREAALAEIVRRYFLTTVGDDAAFELACRLLERGDFTSADQLLERLAMFPDSNVPADEISLRRAVAKSRLGRSETATRLVDSLGPHLAHVQAVLRADISNRPAGPLPAAATESEAMLPRDTLAATQLQPRWEYQPPWTLKGVKANTNNQAIMSGIANGRPMIFVRQAGGNYVQTTLEDKDIPDLSLAELASGWKAAAWRPASRPVAADGRVYLKSELRTVCCDLETGRLLWMGRPTRFPLDEWTRQFAHIAAHGVTLQIATPTFFNGAVPRTLTETMLFAERLSHSVVIDNDRVFAIEGELDTVVTRKKASENTRNQQFMGFSQPAAPDRRNELACYDARTGRLLWSVGRGTILEEGTSFWSAPLVLGDEVILATGSDHQLGVIALRAVDGSLVWKSMLSEFSRTSPTVAVGLTADDGSIFVASGGGVLFSIDRNGGALRWAVTYPRVRTNDPTAERRMQIEGRASPRQQIVLDENFIAREEDALLLAACDSDHVMAFDVADGSLLWDSPLPGPALSAGPGYVVGVRDGRMILSSSRWLWAIRTRGGRIVWDLPLENSCGRGLLTQDALLIPTQRALTQVDPRTGAVVKSTPVETPDSEPAGNLVAAGNQLLLTSAARLMGLKAITAGKSAEAGTPEEPQP